MEWDAKKILAPKWVNTPNLAGDIRQLFLAHDRDASAIMQNLKPTEYAVYFTPAIINLFMK